ncbi:radical SAM protein [Candidatus Gracilibacteria bacterium]|nr:radical SAM protein [Candidatus Gracilibacteria bacterium]
MQYKVFGCKVNKYYTEGWLNSEYLRGKTGTFVASCVVTDSAKRKWVRFVKKEVQNLELPAKVYISGCGAFKDGKAQDNFFDIYPELAFAQDKIEVLDEAPPEQEAKVSVDGLLGTTQNTSIQLSPARGKSELQNSAASSLLQERIERGVAGERVERGVAGKQSQNKNSINLSKLEALKKTQIYTRKYVLIQGGCDSFCTFCLTVQKRGRHFYRSAEDIAGEIQEFADMGGKEAVLTGVNLAAWGLPNTHDIAYFSSDVIKKGTAGGDGSRLSELLRYILEHTTIPRLRISSLGPEFVNDEVIEVLSNSRIIPHFHFSIQSGSSRVLKEMARHYDGDYMRKLLRKILAIPRKDGVDISIGADIIVGFPSETDEDFRDTYELVRDYNITKLHAFPFSEHSLGEGVPAGRFKHQIPEHIKKERMTKLLVLGEEVAQSFYKSQKGKILEVLIEKSNSSAGTWSGWTQNYIEANESNFEVLTGVLRRNEIITGRLY